MEKSEAKTFSANFFLIANSSNVLPYKFPYLEIEVEEGEQLGRYLVIRIS